MIWIVFYLAIFVIQSHGMEKLDCSEPQLFVKDVYCDDSNTSTLTMQTLTKELADNLTQVMINDKCSIINDEYFNLNSTFYIECETEDIDCLEHEESTPDKVIQDYFVECNEPETISYSIQGAQSKRHEVNTTESSSKTMILVSSLVGGGTAAAIAFGIYKMKTILQSGSYLINGGTSSGAISKMP